MGVAIKSKFRERKRLFKLQREKIKKKLLKQENKNSRENPIKIIIFSPIILFGFIKEIMNYYTGEKYSTRKKIYNNIYSNNNANNEIEQKKDSINFNNQDINSFYNKKENFKTKKVLRIVKQRINENDASISTEKENLDNKILFKLKKELMNLQNNTDIIESELYLLNKDTNEQEMLGNAKEIEKEINELLDRIEKINKKYKLMNDNEFDEELINIEDRALIADIINYREKLNSSDFNSVSDKLKLFEEYKYLYKKTEDLKEKTTILKINSDESSRELHKRDKDYAAAKNKIINLDEVNNNCNSIINKHNKYLENILNKIDKRKIAKYKLEGVNGLLTSSLRYIGLLSLIPLRGIIPGIAVRTVAARKLVNSMIRNIHFEKYEKKLYTLTNYQSELNNKIYDIDSLAENIELALGEISELKENFRDYFFKYELKEYDIAYKKILKIEEDIIKNREKLIIIKDMLIKNKELNKKNIVKVRKLNNN